MSIENSCIKAADTMFRVFKEAVRIGIYTPVVDTGFDVISEPYDITVIADSFSEDDIKYLSFSDFVQPQDVKALVRGSSIKSDINAQSDKISIYEKDGSVKQYTVVAHVTDPFKVLYTFLLRKT